MNKPQEWLDLETDLEIQNKMAYGLLVALNWIEQGRKPANLRQETGQGEKIAVKQVVEYQYDGQFQI
jgi:hypothetical protein